MVLQLLIILFCLGMDISSCSNKVLKSQIVNIDSLGTSWLSVYYERIYSNGLNCSSLPNILDDYSTDNEETKIPYSPFLNNTVQQLSRLERFPDLDNDLFKDSRQGQRIPYPLDTSDIGNADSRQGQRIPYPLDTSDIDMWGGKIISVSERNAIKVIRDRMQSLSSSASEMSNYGSWLTTCSDIEILRFLRSKAGDVDDAWQAILRHAAWRISPDGADTIMQNEDFEKSALNREVFWLGVNKHDCPTLVIRTQAHDGVHYNEDPKIFTRFIVWILEQGRLRLSVGTRRQVCVLIDRAPVSGLAPKQEQFDVSVISRLVELFRMIYGTVLENYPELMAHAKMLPTSWFSRMCCGVTLRFMDAHNREKFESVNGRDVAAVMGALFPREALPEHLGGLQDEALYGSVLPLTRPTDASPPPQPASMITTSTTNALH